MKKILITATISTLIALSYSESLSAKLPAETPDLSDVDTIIYESDSSEIRFVNENNLKIVFLPKRLQPLSQRSTLALKSPILAISKSKFPFIGSGIEDAINLDGKPRILQYDPDLARRDKRRAEVCERAVVKKLLLATSSADPAKRAWSCDEYPFASTYQGGRNIAGKLASIKIVPLQENSSQGGVLGAFYRYTLKRVDKAVFQVVVTP
jgi:hypothetical protein